MFTVPQFLSRGQHRNDLLNPVNRGTMQAVRGMKNAPRPCRRKTSARAGSVSDHRTYHTLLWTTRKQHGQRGPKMKWSGAETAKNGRKYSKKVSGACSHPKGSGVRSSSGPPKESQTNPCGSPGSCSYKLSSAPPKRRTSAKQMSFFLGFAARGAATPWSRWSWTARRTRS